MISRVLSVSAFAPAIGFVMSLSSAHAAVSSGINGAGTSVSSERSGGARYSGSVGFDSSSFLYKSDSRGTSMTTVRGTIALKKDSPIFHSEGDLSLFAFVTETPSIGLESREFYTRTQPGLLGNLTITLGRKIEPWSKLDGTWRMMSLWSPRWTWDELRPESVGMTGVFVSYSVPNFKATFFGSPIAIPERGTPVSEKNGNLVSSNPFWKPLPAKIKVLGADAPVNYTLIMPSMQEILFRPNFAAQARLHLDSGFFVSANSGVLPIHMVQMAAEPFLSTSGSESRLQVNIRPQLPMRNINTLELGYDDPGKTWNVWASGSYEQPFRFQNQDSWLNPIITPSTILSAGSGVSPSRDVRIEAAVLSVKEGAFTPSSKLPNVNVALPSRFPIKQGVQLSGKWRISDETASDLTLLQDIQQNNRLISMEISHAFRASPVSVGGGADVILARTTQGWIGNYYGNDRVRGWLKYAF